MLVLTLLIEFAHNHMGQGLGEAHASFSLMAVSCLLKCTRHIVGNRQNVMQHAAILFTGHNAERGGGTVMVVGIRKYKERSAERKQKATARNRKPERKKEIVTKAEGGTLLILWPVCVTSTLLGRQMCG